MLYNKSQGQTIKKYFLTVDFFNISASYCSSKLSSKIKVYMKGMYTQFNVFPIKHLNIYKRLIFFCLIPKLIFNDVIMFNSNFHCNLPNH